MGTPSSFPPQDPVGFDMQEFLAREELRAEERRRFFRRIRLILILSAISFTAVVWVLVRGLAPSLRIGGDPLEVVRAEVGALARGDLESGYSQLSERYRKEVPFQTYHALVASHRRMFATRQYRVDSREEHNGEIYVVAVLTAVTGDRYIARFTLIKIAGRWWIDDFHWGSAGNSDTIST